MKLVRSTIFAYFGAQFQLPWQRLNEHSQNHILYTFTPRTANWQNFIKSCLKTVKVVHSTLFSYFGGKIVVTMATPYLTFTKNVSCTPLPQVHQVYQISSKLLENCESSSLHNIFRYLVQNLGYHGNTLSNIHEKCVLHTITPRPLSVPSFINIAQKL